MKNVKGLFSAIGMVLILTIIFIIPIVYILSGGTHGSIRGYEYAFSKEELEEAINEVIVEENTLERPLHDTLDFNPEKDYYNHDGYISLTIIAPDTFFYIFRFYGGVEDWKNSPNRSEIFICYAYDNQGNGGSDGGGGVEWYHWGLKKKLTNYFENNFISKLDKKLSTTHIETD